MNCLKNINKKFINNYNIILTNSIKKQLLSLLKSLGYGALSLIHGKIKGVVDYKKHPAKSSHYKFR